MKPADEEAAKLVLTEGQSPGAVAGSHDNLEEQFHDVILKDLQRTNHQSKPAEDFGSDGQLDEKLRVSVEALLHPSPPPKPVEEVDDLLLAISHHLDDEASERKKIYNRLLAIQSEMERLASRGFTRYLVALCIGVAVILAWLSYGEATKQIIATRAPKLGWSPEAKQRIASWVQHLGWTKPPVEPVAQTAPEMVAPKAPAASSPDPQQLQQIEAHIAALQQAVERQFGDVRANTELQAADEAILAKIPVPSPRPAPTRKPAPIASSPSSRGHPPTH